MFKKMYVVAKVSDMTSHMFMKRGHNEQAGFNIKIDRALSQAKIDYIYSICTCPRPNQSCQIKVNCPARALLQVKQSPQCEYDVSPVS